MSLPLFDAATSSATFSECRRYRYSLSRHWSSDWNLPLINFVMLNPSTADEVENDPTVERCERRARMWGFRGLIVTNLFAWRSTDPKQLKLVEDPVGPDNDAVIDLWARLSDRVVCAWGKDGAINGRGDQVRARLSELCQLYYLKMSDKTGQPWHPLYLSYDLSPIPWIVQPEALRDAPESSAPGKVPGKEVCSDCPPVGYPSDRTRCDECPRRGGAA